MQTPPRLLWHASRYDIPRPTIANRVEGDNHANSGLGIYCATGPHDYIQGFGGFVHELTIKPDARVLRLTIRELANMGRADWDDEPDRAWFEQEGRRMAENYDLIELVEIDGFAAQAIVLRDDAIVASRKVAPKEFAEQAIPWPPKPSKTPGF